jgi:cytochrome c oxidase subunit II
MQLLRRLPAALTLLLAAAIMLAGADALANVPKPWEMGMQPAANELKARIIDLHNLVLIIITLITIFVGALLVWVMVRYNATRNPVPSTTSHNTTIEVLWTVIPVLILVVIAIPSFRLVYYLDHTPDPDMTIKVTAHQWYWEYGYPEAGELAIESRMIRDEDLKPGQLRLLEVDNQLVVPVGKKIRILTNSVDVIHSFFIPSLGVQRYAIPGRTIETWMTVDKPGVYYGQCNQICGVDHSRMPIAVKAVTQDEYKAWLGQAKKAALTDPSQRRVLADATGSTGQAIQR